MVAHSQQYTQLLHVGIERKEKKNWNKNTERGREETNYKISLFSFYFSIGGNYIPFHKKKEKYSGNKEDLKKKWK